MRTPVNVRRDKVQNLNKRTIWDGREDETREAGEEVST